MPHKALRPNVGTTIVLMLIGYALLGLAGTLVAIPVFATIQNAVRAFTIHLLNRRHLPTDLEAYKGFNVSDYIKKDTGEATGEATPAEDATDTAVTDPHTAEGAE